jgi:signal transduction histidine kinase
MLINDILDLSKIEAEKLDLHYAPVNIKDTIIEIEQIFSSNVNEKGLELISYISPSFPLYIWFSNIRFRQILFNLVGNAIKFTNKGKIELIIDCDCDDLLDRLNMICYVKDTGIGINPEDKEAIFEPFRQSGFVNNDKGTGLGLAITKRLVEMMDGTISIESIPGQGTTFSVYFKDIQIIDETFETFIENPERNYQVKLHF